MKKILIPAVLTATIMIAGMFAIVDVDRVMAGHLPNIGTITSASIGTGVITSDDIGKVIVDADVVANALTGAVLANTLTVDTINDESGGALTVSGAAALTLLGGTASSLKTTIGVLTIESIAAANLELDADDDGVGIILLGEGTDADATVSDVIRIGVDAETTIQKTGANQLTIVATDLILSNGVIGEAELTADAIPFCQNSTVADAAAGGTLAIECADNRAGANHDLIILSTIEITESGVDVDPVTLSLAKTDGGEAGTIVPAAEYTFSLALGTADSFTATWVVTGAGDGVDGGATISYTVTNGGFDAADTLNSWVVIGFALPS